MFRISDYFYRKLRNQQMTLLIKKAKAFAKRIIKRMLKTVRAVLHLKDNKPKPVNKIAQVEASFAGYDRDHVWAFNAGQVGNSFIGNPKYLFIYINTYRPDIKAYWLCPSAETIDYVKSLGYDAYRCGTPEAEVAMSLTGVAVVEQVKASVPSALQQVKMLNLYHGVLFKRIERKLFDGDIAFGHATKYIRNNAWYRDHQLMLVTSPTIEKEFMLDCGIDEDKLIRAGYPRCLYNRRYEPVSTYDHNIRAIKGLGEETRLAVYAPTFRAFSGKTFAAAIESFDRLHALCEKMNLLFIFKPHPLMEKEPAYLLAKQVYADHPYFWFWDNNDDFYEIMDQIDLGIIDYSSIMTDMVLSGVPHFIRYVFDYEEYMQEGFTQGSYFERTVGEICYTFDELLNAIGHYREQDADSGQLRKIKELFWQYSDEDDFERIIQSALDFKVVDREYPTLYSFDVFDTLISRTVLQPRGIFFAVRSHMEQHGGFPAGFVRSYPDIRVWVEKDVREYIKKTTQIRESERVEIYFSEIFERMAGIYHLSDEQVELLKNWELEEELSNSIPLPDQIETLKELHRNGETVVLISDMYLPADFIRRLLVKADPVFADIPLYVSSEYGIQKTSGKLFLEVYKSFEPTYNFGKWVHYGDSPNGDIKASRKLAINSRRIKVPELSAMEKELVSSMDNYDAFLVSALQARLRQTYPYHSADFVIDFVALIMVPYVDYVLMDALERGFQTLYFVSRDGYHLKRIADEVIKAKNYQIKTKYIYGSRHTWVISSFVDEIDPFFWDPAYGSLNNISSKSKLLKGLRVDEETFKELVPEIDLDSVNWSASNAAKVLIPTLARSEAFKEHLLAKAAEERELICRYFEQEIDFSESFAVVEFYGRGYTQECQRRLISFARGVDEPLTYYYARTILPSEGKNIRYNFTTKNTALYFAEAIFANMPYQSIERFFRDDNGVVVPEQIPCNYDKNLFEAMEQLLPVFAREYAKLRLQDRRDTDRNLFEFLLDYYEHEKRDPMVYENIGKLIDSIALNGAKNEFARAYTKADLKAFRNKVPRGKGTSSVNISAYRALPKVQEEMRKMYQLDPDDEYHTGTLLSEKDMKKNADFEERSNKLLEGIEKMNSMYASECRKRPVNGRKIVVIVPKQSYLPELRQLRSLLEQDMSIQVEWISSPDVTAKDVAIAISDARIIISIGMIARLSQLSIRDESEFIILNERPFHIRRFGLAAVRGLRWEKRLNDWRYKLNASALELPSEELKSSLITAFRPNMHVSFSLHGACITDQFFDPAYRAEVRARFNEAYPILTDKKLIFFVFKYKERVSGWLRMPDVRRISRALSEEYAVGVRTIDVPKGTDVKEKYKDQLGLSETCFYVHGQFTTREAMIAADIIVGDYYELFFESMLMDKPVFAYTYDYLTQLKDTENLTIPIDIFENAPSFCSAEEFLSAIRNIDTYDYSWMKQFRSTYFSFCDGHSSERFYDAIKGLLLSATEDESAEPEDFLEGYSEVEHAEKWKDTDTDKDIIAR